MFDPYSLVMAYPYASIPVGDDSTTTVPIFNVLQVYVDPDNAKIIPDNDLSKTTFKFKQTQGFNFGTEITKSTPLTPDRRSAAKAAQPLDVSYHRLLSVSPFDNTLVYAGPSSVTATTLSPPINL